MYEICIEKIDSTTRTYGKPPFFIRSHKINLAHLEVTETKIKNKRQEVREKKLLS